MKNTLVIAVCAGMGLAAMPSGQAIAASLSAGYNVSAFDANCSAVGPGAGFIDETRAACPASVSSGSFLASGYGQASYDTLRASAGFTLSELDPRRFIGPGSGLGNALGTARYDDELTIDIGGRTGEIVELVFETAMYGSMSAIADYTYVYGQADASLLVNVNGTRANVLRNEKSHGTSIYNDANSGRVQIVLGTPFSVTAELTARARLQRTSGNAQAFTGDVFADLSSSAGITSFTLFEAGTGGALIPEWSLGSESGEFGFYTVVPIPATGWLFTSSLLAVMGGFRRRARARRTGNIPAPVSAR